ncbi:RadC family protein [Archangium primigenium]|uniref:RadC family protein n=1 Tax=[Archangium] primigenium TaxID=2792470 RepID=UPI00195AC55B|nr:DNA repair protein RadC [Archangium primigenium]MBM7118305.1 DNA repair protein RadC [Archangium primigenium]
MAREGLDGRAERGASEGGGEGSVRAALEGEDARERLFRLGAEALTDPELLGLLWGAGARTRALAEQLLAPAGGLKALVQQDPRALCARPGLGQLRTAQLLAALELGRRAQRVVERRPRLRTPRDIATYLAPQLGALRREVFHVLCFNARNVLLLDARVAEGTINACMVDPREVFAAAITARATAIVLAHNHPSGDPEPSAQDVGLTAQLVEAGRMLGIKVLDHVVLGSGNYVSMRERGDVPPLEGEDRGPWRMAGERG